MNLYNRDIELKMISMNGPKLTGIESNWKKVQEMMIQIGGSKDKVSKIITTNQKLTLGLKEIYTLWSNWKKLTQQNKKQTRVNIFQKKEDVIYIVKNKTQILQLY